MGASFLQCFSKTVGISKERRQILLSMQSLKKITELNYENL